MAMKKRTMIGMAVAAAAGAAGVYWTAGRRKGQVETIRGQLLELMAAQRSGLQTMRQAAEGGELTAEALGAVDGLKAESVRLEDGALTVCFSNGKAKAWLSDQPLDRLDVYTLPWRGGARPGVLYTESLGDGWYAGYACLHWS